MTEIKQVGYRSPAVLAVLAPSPVSRAIEEVQRLRATTSRSEDLALSPLSPATKLDHILTKPR